MKINAIFHQNNYKLSANYLPGSGSSSLCNTKRSKLGLGYLGLQAVNIPIKKGWFSCYINYTGVYSGTQLNCHTTWNPSSPSDWTISQSIFSKGFSIAIMKHSKRTGLSYQKLKSSDKALQHWYAKVIYAKVIFLLKFTVIDKYILFSEKGNYALR